MKAAQKSEGRTRPRTSGPPFRPALGPLAKPARFSELEIEAFRALEGVSEARVVESSLVDCADSIRLDLEADAKGWHVFLPSAFF
eukprot:300769-Rhodomonas_salina.2